MVAYGGGIRPGAMDLFDRFAEAGSCATAGSDECEPTIVADTPEELKSELTSKIRQIIADKLALLLHQSPLPSKKVVHYIKHNLLMNSLVNGKVLYLEKKLMVKEM